jgi:hypothetical protein
MLTRMPIVVEDASTSQRRFRCTERSHFHARYLAKKNKQRERERERERERDATLQHANVFVVESRGQT